LNRETVTAELQTVQPNLIELLLGQFRAERLRRLAIFTRS